MAHPLGFTMTLTDGTPRQCDVCTAPINGPRIETYVGQAWQSALCLDCANDATKIVQAGRMAKARAARQPSGAIGSVVVAEAVA